MHAFIFNHVESDQLKNFYAAIIRSEFVHIEIGSASPFEIFERMNYRGMDLAVSDLLKNKLFLHAHDHDDLEKMKERWDQITKNAENVTDSINRLTFTTLIRYFYISRFGHVTEKKLYGKLVEKYKDYYDDDLNSFIKDFESVIDILLLLSKKRNELSQIEIKSLPGKNSERGYLRTILALKTFTVIQPYSLLLSLFSKKREIDIRNWLNKIEVFHFVYSYICNGPAREFEKKYADTAKSVFQAKSDVEVQTHLNNLVNEFSILIYKTTNREKFIDDVSRNLTYGSNNDVIRFFYEYLEEECFGRNLQGDTFINDIQISLDHILPQNKEQDHRLGNLIVLETDLNKQLQDSDYQTKKLKVLAGSGISVAKYLFEKNDDWGPEQISSWSKESAAMFWDSIVGKFFPVKK